MNLTGYTDPTISYYEYINWAAYYTFHEVAVSTVLSDTGLVDPIQLTTGFDVSNAWTEKILDLSAYAGQTIYVGWHYTGDLSLIHI